VFGSERLTGALLDRLTHHVHILEMNGDSYITGSIRASVAHAAPVLTSRRIIGRKPDAWRKGPKLRALLRH
jgi:IstB-like ATP binding protein